MEWLKGSPKLMAEIVKIMRDNAKMPEYVRDVAETIKRMIQNQAGTNDDITLNIDSIFSECEDWNLEIGREDLERALRELRGLKYIRFHPSCSIITIEPYWLLEIVNLSLSFSHHPYELHLNLVFHLQMK